MRKLALVVLVMLTSALAGCWSTFGAVAYCPVQHDCSLQVGVPK